MVGEGVSPKLLMVDDHGCGEGGGPWIKCECPYRIFTFATRKILICVLRSSCLDFADFRWSF